MNSSGIKRGLATSAIAALAVTGVPAIANAVPVDAQVGDGNVVLFSQFNGGSADANTDNDIVVRNDGQNNTVRLEAGAGANVPSVTFQYSINGTTFIDIATVNRNDDGAFSYEWDPTALIGATVTIRATGTPAGGTAQVDDQADVEIVGAGTGVHAVNITDGTRLGVFQQPYGALGNGNLVVVSGTTSATTGSVTLSRRTGTGAAANTTTTPVNAPAADSTETFGRFRGTLNLAGYEFSGTGAADQVVIGAERDTDDVEAFTLYKQAITTVTATADRTNVPAGQNATVTVTVTDQDGAPIAGASVRDGNQNFVGFTNANGQVTDTRGAGTTFYYANATASAPYEAELGDKRSADVTITQFAAAPTSLVATSRDGAAFDFDENTLGDITVQVTDQAGNNFDVPNEQDLQYYWVVTPFAGGTPIRVPATGTTEANETGLFQNTGRFEVVFPAGQPAGTYELFGALEANNGGNNAIASTRLLTVKAGQSSITFDQAGPEVGTAGGSETVAGKLTLADGTGLAGRSVQVTYTSTGGNAAIVQATGADAASRTVTTGPDGSFSVVVRDPAVASGAQPTERGTVTATTVNGTSDNDNPGATATQQVVFAQETPAAGSTITIGGAIAANNQSARPGEAVGGTVTVTNGPGNTPVANQRVTLTVDGDSFFTDGSPAATPVAGQDAGALRNLGKTLVVVTDATGTASFQVSVARSTEFDDDGLAEDIVTATAGSFSDTEDVDYNSANPLNGGSVELVQTPANEQRNPTDPTAVGNRVYFDVVTTDQFGNRVGGENVTITDNSVDATVVGEDAAPGTPGLQVASDFDSRGDFYVTASRPGEVTVTGTWVADTFRYTTAGGTGTPVVAPGGETLTDTATADFYAVDFAASEITLTTSANGSVPVGTAVTATVKVIDQEGNPVPGLTVEFIRQGPGGQDGDPNITRTTNANGEAFYSFTGTERGTARISAVVTDGMQNQTLSTTVEFGKRESIKATATGSNRASDGFDRVRVAVDKPAAAAGAAVELYKINAQGKARRVKTKALNDRGFVQWIRPDLNGNKVSRYYAIVRPTDNSTQARSNTVRIR